MHEAEHLPRFRAVLRPHRDDAAFLAVRLRRRQEHRHLVFAVDDVVGARGDAFLTEVGELEGALPVVAAIGGVVEARWPGVNALHARGEHEVRVREVDAARTVDGRLAALFGRDAGLLRARRRPQARGAFDGPGLAAVLAAREEVLGGFGVVDGVAAAFVHLEVARLEADEDLVAPGPDTVIRGPAAEATGFLVDVDVLDGARRAGRRLARCSAWRPGGRCGGRGRRLLLHGERRGGCRGDQGERDCCLHRERSRCR